MVFHPLLIKKIIQETSDAYSLVFDLTPEIFSSFLHRPGQYVTVKAEINGKEIRRPYSINSIPGSSEFSITVKKVTGGLMSLYLSQRQKGEVLEVAQPEGHFTLTPDHTKARAHYFIAAGSGITPIMSMVQTVLEEEPKSTCYLLYGSRNEENIIFKATLEALANKYKGQLYIQHVLSQPAKSKAPGLGGLLGKKQTDWKGPTGRINEKLLFSFLEDFPTRHADKQFYICGPGDMIEKIEKTLLGKKVESNHVHKEYFTPASSSKHADQNEVNGGKSTLKVTLKGATHEFVMDGNKIILDQLVEKKLDPPYSCTSGACSTCMAKVTSGQVKMDVCYALEPDEVEAGYILTCQARPMTSEVSLTYDI